jgi:hypothetical protein
MIESVVDVVMMKEGRGLYEAGRIRLKKESLLVPIVDALAGHVLSCMER